MATIRKRTRYRGTLKAGGSPVTAKTFAREDAAQSWLRGEKRKAVRERHALETLDSDLRQSTSYQAIVRLRGHPAEYATFDRLTDAKKWAGQTEAAIREGRHFRFVEGKRRSLADLVDRYQREILDRKPLAKRKWRCGDHLGDLLHPPPCGSRRRSCARDVVPRRRRPMR